MIEQIHSLLLLIAVVWPLLLAIPALHSRLPWPRHLAIAPAVVLIVLPGEGSLVLPWFLFGTGLALDTDSRWILLMSVAVWFLAVMLSRSSRDFSPGYDNANTLFLLTLAGNLGAVLAADLVGFFCFSTLMGYGFYGLLIHGGDKEVRRAGRLYLLFVIVADLVLFEALLLAASTTLDLRYAALRPAMAGAPSLQFYSWMVLIGFALKAGIWPLHLWLLGAFNLQRRSTTWLLAGVPVAMGLLGAVRWFPSGETALEVLGTTMQVMGVAALLYAALKFFRPDFVRMRPAWATLAVTGLFVAALGTGLAQPGLWRPYAGLMHPLIAASGIFLTALTVVIGRRQETHPQHGKALSPSVAGWWSVARRWIRHRGLKVQSFWRAIWLQAAGFFREHADWQKPAFPAGGWSAAISLFVLLGLVIAWLSY